MRESLLASVLVCSTILVADMPAVHADATAASVLVTAQFSSRTSLKLSSQVLRFEVTSPDRAALAVIDFSAAARTRQDGEVVLTVQAIGTLAGPGGAADPETSLTFAGQGEGMLAGDLRPSAVSLAGRWIGSGLRTGRLTFALRSPAAGTYSLPVRLVL